ncbi:hypothetical protein HD841_002398 [Sphingomonas melonis]|uniref:Uncharacterized protein n=1 Tax=Sphingomonas melonis TaxID=152682 RepID=A0A7Y9FR03_9SPHN|nr:hypothetical protein [Sphingomonas melonis]
MGVDGRGIKIPLSSLIPPFVIPAFAGMTRGSVTPPHHIVIPAEAGIHSR